ncbi:unnamed protein product [Euphydryas editha]|uniref:Uncharacterized protein n=1 Tax=Euphydryas editha TaxID=104508 RepID=A0AAU9TVN6_EUPED|nr:unnamed protein product [Euphydryas editha]
MAQPRRLQLMLNHELCASASVAVRSVGAHFIHTSFAVLPTEGIYDGRAATAPLKRNVYPNLRNRSYIRDTKKAECGSHEFKSEKANYPVIRVGANETLTSLPGALAVTGGEGRRGSVDVMQTMDYSVTSEPVTDIN